MQSDHIQQWQLDRQSPWHPHQGNETDLKTDDLEVHNAGLCCVRCLHLITEHAAHLDMAGGHIHVFTNPSGITYELALFSQANCLIQGPATTEYTWFAGYAWQLALCSNCYEHLGWRYLKPGNATFYGLIRDRLREINT